MVHSEESRRKLSESCRRPLKLSSEELFDLYWNRNLSLSEIGEKLKKPKTTIYGWMKHHKIPTRTIGEAKQGRRLSEDHKRKISLAIRGKNNPNWGKRGTECGWYGRKATSKELEEKRQRMLGSKNPMYGKTPWSAGLTKETDSRLMRISQRMTGRQVSNETREKLSKAVMGKHVGKNHPNWQGGLKDNPYGIEYNEKLRRQIRERDGFLCQLCDGTDVDRELQVHHINYDKTDNHPENLVSLCLRCHVKTNYDRKHWISLFKALYLKRAYN